MHKIKQRLAVVFATAAVGVSGAVFAAPAQAGTVCDWTHICGNLYNYGTYALRVDTNLGDKVVWDRWLYSGHSTRGDGIVDVDAFYLPKGSCATTWDSASRDRRYYGSKSYSTINKITDIQSLDVKTYYC